ncbi:uncharacterized protein [Coffea arabica]|uniref:Uncharacterized protein LOC113734686 n=1 Tax=Coffea arabica TaxID=13443 RepID=A0A6P6WNU3_COFAR|nr:uncharacterized protein LOC113734686 [Coffea arabica]
MKNGESTYEPPRGRGKNKCFWTPEEVKALVEALKELSYDPLWKNDGGFKQNYMFEVHNIISSKIPNFTKKVDPHVESKVKWLKSKFYAISKMLRQSGCKWNAAEKMISCERQWYDNWVKAHKEAKGLWNMKFPYLRDLEVVYGDDIVKAEEIEGFEDADQNIETALIEANVMDFSDEGNEEANSVTQDKEANTTSTNTLRKQKRQTSPICKESKKVKTSVAPLLVPEQFELMTGKFEVLLDHLATIATTMAKEDQRAQLAADRSNRVVEELLKLGLPTGDLFGAANILCAESSKLNVFFQLSPKMRRQYVNYLLYPTSSLSGSSN